MRRVRRLIGMVWRTLGNTWLAAFLLATLLVVTVLASLFPQAPAEAAAREPWLAAVTLRYGRSTRLFDALGLFDAYQTSWFLALLAALLLNTLVCTVQRLPRLWHSLTRTPAGTRPDAVHQATSLLSHLAAVVLVIAISARPALAVEETGVKLLPGQAYCPDRDCNFAVRTGPLAADLNGQPLDYRASLVLMAEGSPAVTETVHINHPASFHSITFYLQGYGPAAEVITPEGTFSAALAGDQIQEVTLPTEELCLRLAYRTDGPALYVEALDTSGASSIPLGSGLVSDGEQIQVRGVPITLRLSNYTIWHVSRDPTFGAAVGAAGLLLAAVLASLWLPRAPDQRRALEKPPEAGCFQEIGTALPPQPSAGNTEGTNGQMGVAARPIGTWLALGVAVVLTGLLAGLGLRASQWPLSTERQVALAFALATALAAVAIGLAAKGRGNRTAQTLTLGLAVALAAYALLGVPGVQPTGNHWGLPLLDSVWFPLHVGTAVIAYGALAMAGAVGAAWLFSPAERPNAERLLERAATVGYPLLTLSMLLGMVWGQMAWGRYWNWDLKEVWTLVVWLIYTLYWHVRRRLRWQGRWLAWLAIAGLVAVLFTFLGVDWLARGVGVEDLRLF